MFGVNGDKLVIAQDYVFQNLLKGQRCLGKQNVVAKRAFGHSFKTFSKVKGVWGHCINAPNRRSFCFKTFSKVKGVWGLSYSSTSDMASGVSKPSQRSKVFGEEGFNKVHSQESRFKTFSKVKGVWGRGPPLVVTMEGMFQNLLKGQRCLGLY